MPKVSRSFTACNIMRLLDICMEIRHVFDLFRTKYVKMLSERIRTSPYSLIHWDCKIINHEVAIIKWKSTISLLSHTEGKWYFRLFDHIQPWYVVLSTKNLGSVDRVVLSILLAFVYLTRCRSCLCKYLSGFMVCGTCTRAKSFVNENKEFQIKKADIKS